MSFHCSSQFTLIGFFFAHAATARSTTSNCPLMPAYPVLVFVSRQARSTIDERPSKPWSHLLKVLFSATEPEILLAAAHGKEQLALRKIIHRVVVELHILVIRIPFSVQCERSEHVHSGVLKMRRR